MIPIMMKILIREEGKKGFRLYIPLILIWIVLFALLIILLPFLLLAAIIAWPMGYGRAILAVIPMLFAVIWSMSGLKIHIESKDKLVDLNVR
jgi:hypothetical protein